jgi:teichuronic acid exporter
LNKWYKATIASSVTQIIMQVVQLLASIVIARLIGPDVRGVYAISFGAFTVLQLLATWGTNHFVASQLEVKKTVFESALGFLVPVCFSVGILSFASAALVANALNEPTLTDPIRILSFYFFLSPWILLVQVYWQVTVKVKFGFLSQTIRALASAVIAIYLAYSGFGASAMAWGWIGGAVVYLIYAFYVDPDTRIFKANWTGLKPIVAFGQHQVSYSLAVNLLTRLQEIAILKSYGSSAVGFYSQALALAEPAKHGLADQPVSAARIGISAAADDRKRLTNAYRRLMNSVMGLVIPCLSGIAVCSAYLIDTLYGPKWAETSAILVPICFLLIAQSLPVAKGELLMAVGSVQRLARLEIIASLVGAGALLLVLSFGFSVANAIWVRFGVAAVFSITQFHAITKFVDISFREFGIVLLQSLLVGIVGASPFFLWPLFGAATPMQKLMLFASLGVLSFIAFLACLWLFRHPTRSEIASLVTNFRSPK